MILMFTQDHRAAGRLELSVVKLHEATAIFVMVDYVREVTAKKSCKYGKYGSFENLVFLFV